MAPLSDIQKAARIVAEKGDCPHLWGCATCPIRKDVSEEPYCSSERAKAAAVAFLTDLSNYEKHSSPAKEGTCRSIW